MAKIQALGGGQRISTDVQVAKQDPRAAGLVWGAVGKAAGQVANVADAFVEKAEAAEAADYSLNKSLDYQTKLGELERTLKPQYANNPDGYAKAFEAEAVSLRQALTEEAPSERAKQGFLRNTDAALLSKVTQSYAVEQSNKVYQFERGFSERAAKLSNIQYASPDPIGAQLARDKEMLNIEEQVAGGLLGREKADALIDDLDKNVRVGFLSGLEKNNYGGIVDINTPPAQREKALDAYLSGGGKVPSIIDNLPPNVKQRVKDEAMQSFARQDAQRVKAADAALTRDLKRIFSGEVGATTPAGTAMIQNQVRSIAGNTAIDPDMRDAMMTKLTKTVTESEMKKGLALGGNVERVVAGVSEIFNGVQKGLGDSMATEVGQRASELKAELDLEFAKSPADYLAKYDPALAATKGSLVNPDPARAVQSFDEFKSRADALFDQRNTPQEQRRYLPSEVAKTFKSQFDMSLSTGDYKAANGLFSKLEAMGDGSARGLMKEVGIPERFMVIGEVSDQAERQRLFMLTNPAERTKVDSDFKNTFYANESVPNIKADLMEDQYYNDLKGVGMLSDQSQLNASAVLESVEGLYKMNRLGGASDSEARESAWNTFKKENTVIKGTANYNIVLPKSFSPTAVKGVEGLIGTVTDGSDEEIREALQLADDVRPSSIADKGVFSFNPATGRVHLVTKEYDANTQKVEVRAFYNNQGKPISFSPEELETYKPAPVVKYSAQTSPEKWSERQKNLTAYFKASPSKMGTGTKSMFQAQPGVQ